MTTRRNADVRAADCSYWSVERAAMRVVVEVVVAMVMAAGSTAISDLSCSARAAPPHHQPRRHREALARAAAAAASINNNSRSRLQSHRRQIRRPALQATTARAASRRQRRCLSARTAENAANPRPSRPTNPRLLRPLLPLWWSRSSLLLLLPRTTHGLVMMRPISTNTLITPRMFRSIRGVARQRRRLSRW